MGFYKIFSIPKSRNKFNGPIILKDSVKINSSGKNSKIHRLPSFLRNFRSTKTKPQHYLETSNNFIVPSENPPTFDQACFRSQQKPFSGLITTYSSYHPRDLATTRNGHFKCMRVKTVGSDPDQFNKQFSKQVKQSLINTHSQKVN